MIKAILFDIDGVLIDSFNANLEFINDVFIKAGYKGINRKQYVTLFHANLKEIIIAMIPYVSEDEVKRVWNIGNHLVVPFPVTLLKMPKSVPSVIKTLAVNYKLGLVTNRLHNGVYDFHKMAVLKNYFSIVVAYEDTQNHKPHPEPLLFAAKQIGVSVEECIYVGDLETDVQAAKAAGMKVVICSKDKFDSADGYAKTFREIPKVISKLHG